MAYLACGGFVILLADATPASDRGDSCSAKTSAGVPPQGLAWSSVQGHRDGFPRGGPFFT